MPLTQADIIATWSVAEVLLRRGEIETAICTLHGLLLTGAASSSASSQQQQQPTTTNQMQPFPNNLFQSEIMTRLRLCFIILHCTIGASSSSPTYNLDSARKILEDTIKRFEGVGSGGGGADFHHHGSSSGTTPTFSLSSSQAASLTPEQIFEKKFPFSLQILKCHALKMIGESWSLSVDQANSGKANRNGLLSQPQQSALRALKDAARICQDVIRQTKRWLSVATNNVNNNSSGSNNDDNSSSSTTTRRQREDDDEDVNNKSNNLQTIPLRVWRVASLHLASLLLSIRLMECSILYQVAFESCNKTIHATHHNTSSSSSSSSTFLLDSTSIMMNMTNDDNHQNNRSKKKSSSSSCLHHQSASDQVVFFTTRALSEFMQLAPINNNSNCKIKKEEADDNDTKDNDDDAIVKKEEDDDDDEVLRSVGSSSSSTTLLYPEHQLGLLFRQHDKQNSTTSASTSSTPLTSTLACFAMYHIYCLLLSPLEEQQKRAIGILQKWSVSRASLSNNVNNNKNSSSSSSSFTHIWRFLLMLATGAASSHSDEHCFETEAKRVEQRAFEKEYFSEDGIAEREEQQRQQTSKNTLFIGNNNNTKNNSQNNINDNKKSERGARNSAKEAKANLQSSLGSMLHSSPAAKKTQLELTNSQNLAREQHNANGLRDWISASIVPDGCAKAAFDLVKLVRKLQNFCRSNYCSNNDDDDDNDNQKNEDDANKLDRHDDHLDGMNHILNLVNEHLKNIDAFNLRGHHRGVAALRARKNESYYETKFLQCIKLSVSCEMALWDLSVIDLTRALDKIYTLKILVCQFGAHTMSFRPTIHLLIAMLSMWMGMGKGANGCIMMMSSSSSSNRNNSNNIDSAGSSSSLSYSPSFFEVMQSHCIQAARAALPSSSSSPSNAIEYFSQNENTGKYVSFVLGGTTNSTSSSDDSANNSLIISLSRSTPLLVEVCGIYSFLKANSLKNDTNKNNNNNLQQSQQPQLLSISDIRNLQQRFNTIVDEVKSVVSELEEMIAQRNNSNNNNNKQTSSSSSSTSTFSSSPLLLMWKLLFAIRCIEDRNADESLGIIRKVIETCSTLKLASKNAAKNRAAAASATTSKTSSPTMTLDSASASFSSSTTTINLSQKFNNNYDSQKSNTNTNNNNISSLEEYPVPVQYILATALRLGAIANSLQGDLTKASRAVKNSCIQSEHIDDEQNDIHCISFALQSLLLDGGNSSSSSGDAMTANGWGRATMLNKLQEHSAAVSSLISRNEQEQGSRCREVFSFLPGTDRDYDLWVAKAEKLKNEDEDDDDDNNLHRSRDGAGNNKRGSQQPRSSLL